MSRETTERSAYWDALHKQVERELKAERIELRQLVLLAISEVHSGDAAEGSAIAKAIFRALSDWLDRQASLSDDEMSCRALGGLSDQFAGVAHDD